jgi:hypothetical protein
VDNLQNNRLVNICLILLDSYQQSCCLPNQGFACVHKLAVLISLDKFFILELCDITYCFNWIVYDSYKVLVAM